MPKEVTRFIKIVYQDCPDCGANKRWYDEQATIAKENGIGIKKMSFIEPGAKGLIIKAASHGIQRMPFFTSDDNIRPRRFSYKMEDFIPKKERTKKAGMEVKKEDGNLSED